MVAMEVIWNQQSSCTNSVFCIPVEVGAELEVPILNPAYLVVQKKCNPQIHGIAQHQIHDAINAAKSIEGRM